MPDNVTPHREADAWLRIDLEARVVALAALEHDESTPLEFGAFIAWTECQFGFTNALSVLHRVGFPQHDDQYATCGEPIPAPVRWLPLSPAIVRTMRKCQYCEAEVARIERGRAA